LEQVVRSKLVVVIQHYCVDWQLDALKAEEVMEEEMKLVSEVEI
jgi:hypothetical protein